MFTYETFVFYSILTSTWSRQGRIYKSSYGDDKSKYAFKNVEYAATGFEYIAERVFHKTGLAIKP